MFRGRTFPLEEPGPLNVQSPDVQRQEAQIPPIDG